MNSSRKTFNILFLSYIIDLRFIFFVLTSPSSTGSLGGKGLIHWGPNPSNDKFCNNPVIVSSLSPDPIFGMPPGCRSNLKFKQKAIKFRTWSRRKASQNEPCWIGTGKVSICTKGQWPDQNNMNTKRNLHQLQKELENKKKIRKKKHFNSFRDNN